jgi:hypothetical protein
VGALVNMAVAGQETVNGKPELLQMVSPYSCMRACMSVHFPPLPLTLVTRQQIVDAVLKECSKKDLDYKALVLPHFSELMKAFPKDMYFEKIAEIATPLLSSNKMETR